jgi:hypothetical protein
MKRTAMSAAEFFRSESRRDPPDDPIALRAIETVNYLDLEKYAKTS